MASGLPMVVSDIEAVNEVINDIECGVKVDPSNENGIRDGMLKLMGLDEAVRVHMGERARTRVLDYFSIDRVTNEISEIYQELLSE